MRLKINSQDVNKTLGEMKEITKYYVTIKANGVVMMLMMAVIKFVMNRS